MANQAVAWSEFRREAKAAIRAWMDAQKPPCTQDRLSQILGYRDSTTTSKNLKGDEPEITAAFLERVAAEIPPLAWLLARHDEIKRGGIIQPPADTREGRSAALRELAELRRVIVEAVDMIIEKRIGQ